jgi:beta-mannanase
VLLPYLAISAVSILPALLVSNAGAAHGYYFWSLANGAIYLLVAIAVVRLHVVENRSSKGVSTIRFLGPRTAAIGIVAAALVTAVVLRGGEAVGGLALPGAPSQAEQALAYVPPFPARRGGTVDVGVTTARLARNSFHPWTARDLLTVNAFEQHARKHVSIVMWYADWQQALPSVAQLNAVEERGSTPEITWEPWDWSKGLRVAQPRYRLQNVIDGRFDAYIVSWARALAAWGKPVRLRLAQEMNGTWYDSVNGNHPGEFVRFWRHVHAIFERVGATNVRWVWSPVSGAARSNFPGPSQVDVIGVTCLNGGSKLFTGKWRSFESTCGPSISELHALAPRLPIEISEIGSAEAGGSKAAWITGMFAFLAQHQEVKSIIWFDLAKQTDWRIESSTAAERAFMAGVQAPRYR